MLKVTEERQRNGGVILKLEGRLAAAWVGELSRSLDAALADGAAVTLDLEGLAFADARGVALLRSSADLGVRLTGESQFIGALIAEEHR